MSRGVLLFAHDNDAFDYHRIVPTCAWFVKKHLGVPVALVTDDETKTRLLEQPGASDLIDEFVMVTHDESNAARSYRSSDNSVTTPGQFLNKTRTDMYELTPFEETIFMDLDYIVMNDSLSQVWGADAAIRANYDITTVRKEHSGCEDRVHPLGITRYWSTVMYFRKSPEAEALFQGIQYIKKNYTYMSRLYRFSDRMFLNDIALSVMAHSMNGGEGIAHGHPLVQSLPEPTLLFAWDDQPVLKVADGNRAWFVGNPWGDGSETHVTYTRGQSVHMVNKQALLDVVVPWVEKQIEAGDV